MKSKFILFSLTFLMFGISNSGFSQTPWYVVGNNIASNNYLGTNNNFPLNIHTNSVSRMRINGTTPLTNIQSFINQNTAGFVGITADPSYWTGALSPQTPVSLLHLIGDYNGHIPFAYRPWMRNGVSFTLGADMGFVGPRLVNDESDKFEMVMAWGDPPMERAYIARSIHL